jgi:uncharacterized phage protein (TIGR01671 family)
MEDRYLFKAKRTDNGEWVQGYLFDDGFENARVFIGGLVIEKYTGTACDDWTISGSCFCEVDKSTICQCTGLKDKNGKLIWENDIVKDLFSDACAQIKYGSYQSCFDSTKTEHVGFYVDWSGKCTKRYRKDLGYWINMVNAEVIGNIFDDPELIKEI